MSLVIDQPEIEALIQQRMASGAYEDVEAVLLHTLKAAPQPEAANTKSRNGRHTKTARKSLAQLFAESPFKGTDMEFPRDKAPLRSVDL